MNFSLILNKVTRVISFMSNPDEYSTELNEAGLLLGVRDDLRIAKVTNSTLISFFKDKFKDKWYNQFSTNFMILAWTSFKSKEIRYEFMDLAVDSTPLSRWINLKSLELCDELNIFTQRILNTINYPIFVAFTDVSSNKTRGESIALLQNLEKLATKYSNIIFTYVDGFGAQIQRKQKMGIRWTTVPAFAYLNHDETDMMPFKHEYPFTMQNLIAYVEHFVKSNFHPKSRVILPDKPLQPKRGRVGSSYYSDINNKKEDL